MQQVEGQILLPGEWGPVEEPRGVEVSCCGLLEQRRRGQGMRGLKRLSSDPQCDEDDKGTRAHKNVTIEGVASSMGFTSKKTWT